MAGLLLRQKYNQEGQTDMRSALAVAGLHLRQNYNQEVKTDMGVALAVARLHLRQKYNQEVQTDMGLLSLQRGCIQDRNMTRKSRQTFCFCSDLEKEKQTDIYPPMSV